MAFKKTEKRRKEKVMSEGEGAGKTESERGEMGDEIDGKLYY